MSKWPLYLSGPEIQIKVLARLSFLPLQWSQITDSMCCSVVLPPAGCCSAAGVVHSRVWDRLSAAEQSRCLLICWGSYALLCVVTVIPRLDQRLEPGPPPAHTPWDVIITIATDAAWSGQYFLWEGYNLFLMILRLQWPTTETSFNCISLALEYVLIITLEPFKHY